LIFIAPVIYNHFKLAYCNVISSNSIPHFLIKK
jgi:hypothetical protein